MVTQHVTRICFTVLLTLPMLSFSLFAGKQHDNIPDKKASRSVSRVVLAQRSLQRDVNQTETKIIRIPSEQVSEATNGTITITEVNFEGAFPPDGWEVFDNDGVDHGEYFWWPDDNNPYSGFYSGWCARGGANGLDPEGSTYPNNCDSWFIFGPFDLSDADEAAFSFMTWIDSPDTNDYLFWGASLDGVDFRGKGYLNSITWSQATLDLKRDIISLGDLTGQEAVWVAINFESDEANTAGGAYVDDVVLTKGVDSAGLNSPHNLVAMPGPDKVDLRWESPSSDGQTVELAYDDGTPGGFYHWSPGARMASRMSPGGSCKITAIQIYCARAQNYKVGIYDWTGSEPGSELLETGVVSSSEEGWNTTDVSSYNIYVTGDFIASFNVVDTVAALGFDESDNGRAWDYTGTWNPFDETYFIRAVVETQTLNKAPVEAQVLTLQGYNIYRSTTSPVVVESANKIASTNAGDTTYTDTDVVTNMTYYYVVTAVYTDGESGPSNQVSATIGVDATAPVISHASPTDPVESVEPVDIEATITDNVGVSTATLFYRKGGATSYGSVQLVVTNGASYSGTIPAFSITPRGVEYYILATDPSNNRSTSPASNPETHPHVLIVKVNNLTKTTQQPARSYRMISIPIDLDNASPDAVLVDDLGSYNNTVWRLFRFQGNAYVENTVGAIESFESGNGFWLITKDTKTIDSGQGQSVSTGSDYTVSLQPGWNMIGNPFYFDVDWNEVVKDAAVEDVLWGSNDGQGYTAKNQLVPWEGYFVKNTESYPVNIAIPPKASNGSAKSDSDVLTCLNGTEETWTIQVKARIGSFSDCVNYIGSTHDAQDEWDRRDISEPPASPGEYVSLYFPHQGWTKNPGKYALDFRPPSEEGTVWDFQVETNILNTAGLLEFENLSSIPTSFDVVLVDPFDHKAMDLRSDNRYPFRAKESRTFSIAIGKKEFTERYCEHVLPVPDRFALGQNYPNPFNADTRITYQLPQPCHVTVKIFNLLGQEVKTLMAEQREAGQYQIVWDGTNHEGSDVSSGAYLYRLETEYFSQTKRLILLR